MAAVVGRVISLLWGLLLVWEVGWGYWVSEADEKAQGGALPPHMAVHNHVAW